MTKEQNDPGAQAVARSTFIGETWLAYRLGEHKVFKTHWVLCRKRGIIYTAVLTRKELMSIARGLGVKLKWSRKIKP